MNTRGNTTEKKHTIKTVFFSCRSRYQHKLRNHMIGFLRKNKKASRGYCLKILLGTLKLPANCERITHKIKTLQPANTGKDLI